MVSISPARAFRGWAFLSRIDVPVIGRFNTPDGMTENPLCNIWANTSTTHERASSPAQIVNRPVRYACLFVEHGFAPRHSLNVGVALGGEDVWIAGVARLRVDDRKRCGWKL